MRKSFVSTSSPAKVKLDQALAKKINITSDQHVLMLVGAPDGLERHYQNVLSWGGDLKKLTIIDCLPGVIQLLEQHHDAVLNKYERPQFIVGDLNEQLEQWPADKPLGVIDFDGTTGLSVYHLDSLKHAERLGARYVIMVAVPRASKGDIKSFAKGLNLVDRKAYVSKTEQLESKGKYHPAYTKTQRALATASTVVDAIAEVWGWNVLHSCNYVGVSQMSCSLYELSQKPDLECMREDLRRHKNVHLYKSLCGHADLFDEEREALTAKERWLAFAESVNKQYSYIKTSKFKELIKQPPKDKLMNFEPNDEWWLKHDRNEFKDRYPKRYKLAVKREALMQKENLDYNEKRWLINDAQARRVNVKTMIAIYKLGHINSSDQKAVNELKQLKPNDLIPESMNPEHRKHCKSVVTAPAPAPALNGPRQWWFSSEVEWSSASPIKATEAERLKLMVEAEDLPSYKEIISLTPRFKLKSSPFDFDFRAVYCGRQSRTYRVTLGGKLKISTNLGKSWSKLTTDFSELKEALVNLDSAFKSLAHRLKLDEKLHQESLARDNELYHFLYKHFKENYNPDYDGSVGVFGDLSGKEQASF